MHTHESEVRVSKLILIRVSLDNNINNINNTNKSKCFCKIPGIFAKRFFSMGRYFAEKMIQKGQKQKIGSFFLLGNSGLYSYTENRGCNV